LGIIQTDKNRHSKRQIDRQKGESQPDREAGRHIGRNRQAHIQGKAGKHRQTERHGHVEKHTNIRRH